MSDRLSEYAPGLARIALRHVTREFPYASVHVMTGPNDMLAPIERHPIFYGSFDWHSCVHSHWLLARILRLYPDDGPAPAIRNHFDQVFTAKKVAVEAAY
ncbi:MAG TPA: DUF2891 family protein, partial [Caulobacteraceae bacterium]